LIGTPGELMQVISSVNGGGDFVAGETLCAVVLDEVDVLLPLPPKQLRTSLDDKKGADKKKKSTFNTAQDERRKLEQKRKLMTAKRQGAETNSDKQLIAPTEKLLGLVASNRFVGGVNANAPQILAGSATASRRTLDRLNSALRSAAESGGAGTFESIWSTQVKTVRPEELEDATTSAGSSDVAKEDEQHTIRAVTVPQEVMHRYISLTKEEASSSDAVLTAVAKAAGILKPETALVFLCGEFAKTNIKAKAAIAKPIPISKTSKARRDLTRRREAAVATKVETKVSSIEPLSARRACSTLKQLGIEAQPLHVALGLEMNSKDSADMKEGDEAAPFLVTFEGSARGLHFDEVDAVFVVGRPASAASYLHLAGRVGRSSPSKSVDGGVMIRPGTVVSLCTKGSATELEKWTRQIGGTVLEELVIGQSL
jgi:Helicase conserved C-terminal domain